MYVSQQSNLTNVLFKLSVRHVLIGEAQIELSRAAKRQPVLIFRPTKSLISHGFESTEKSRYEYT